MIGSKISHYQIVEKLGEGGMGVVYKAIDTILDRPVALKFVSSAVTIDKTIKERLMREAKACAALNHPNITTIYEFGEDDDRAFIAMEYVEGRTLQEITIEKRLEIQEILEVARQITDALSTAHKKGIIHRDLKPANIMQDVTGRIKVMDFGLAKLAQASLLTISGATLGTAAYMSPEQAQGIDLDHRSDIYSMGVILYQLSTGKLPFMDTHPLAVMYAIQHDLPTLPREVNPEISENFEKVIMRALEKEPESRYADISEMNDDLRHIQLSLNEPSIEKTPRGTTIQRTSRVKARIRKKLGSVFKYVLPLILLVAVPTIWLFKNKMTHETITSNSVREVAKKHLNIGMAYLDKNEFGLAHLEIEIAVKTDPTYSAAWSSLAAVSVRLEDFDSAIIQSKKAIGLDRNNSNAHYNLAYALEENTRYFDAVKSYENAINVDSTFTQAFSALGNLYIRLEKLQEALIVLNKALVASPDSPYNYLIYKNLGKAHYKLSNYEQAIQLLTRSQQEQPVEESETIYFLALSYDADGRKKESIAMWQRYVEIASDSAKRAQAMKRLQSLQN